MTSASLYLVTEAGPVAAERLAAVLAKHAVASVLIKPAGGDPGNTEALSRIVKIAQQHGVAALLAEDAELTRCLGADGVHIDAGSDLGTRYDQAREILGPDAIVGCTVGKSRHTAMLMGEKGADYVGFGAPADLSDQEGAIRRRLELIAWWAELFEIPCVAFDVAQPGEAQRLAAAGADFVSCRLAPGSSASDALDRVSAFARAMSEPLMEA